MGVRQYENRLSAAFLIPHRLVDTIFYKGFDSILYCDAEDYDSRHGGNDTKHNSTNHLERDGSQFPLSRLRGWLMLYKGNPEDPPSKDGNSQTESCRDVPNFFLQIGSGVQYDMDVFRVFDTRAPFKVSLG